jgi:hypothetical protein
MSASAWIEQLADDIGRVAADLRPLVRELHQDETHRLAVKTKRAGGGRSVAISENEARTLLRAAQPVPQMPAATRNRHATMLAALSTFSTALHELNDPIGGGPATIAAALAMRDALDSWIKATRWRTATSRAGVSWPVPAELPIRPLPRLSTGAGTERIANPALIEDQPATVQRNRPGKSRAAKQLPLLLPIAATSSAATSSAAPPLRRSA